MKRRIFLVSAALIAVGSLAACSTKAEIYRYRITVQLETPAGIRSGSSVIEARVARTDGSMVPIEARGVRTQIKGEAVTVDLGNGKLLFALLQNADSIAFLAREHEIQVPANQLPMLVTFTDLSDPTSVAEVDPDDLAATFGEGVRLKRITVQLTDDPVTTGIEKRLAWLTDPAVMENPGWRSLPYEVRVMLIGLRAGKVGAEK